MPDILGLLGQYYHNNFKGDSKYNISLDPLVKMK